MPYEVLIRQLADEDEDVRQNAAWILGQLCVKDVVGVLHGILKDDPSPWMRHTAAVSLGRIRDPQSLVALSDRLEAENDPMARMGSAIGLGLMKEASAQPALKAALDRPENAPLRPAIAEALKSIASLQHRQRSSLDKKIEKAKRDVAESPENGAAHNNLGVAYFHNRQYDLAMQHCDRARTLGAGVAWLEERLKPHRKSGPGK